MLLFIPLMMMLASFFSSMPCKNEICCYSSELHCNALVNGHLALCRFLELTYVEFIFYASCELHHKIN